MVVVLISDHKYTTFILYTVHFGCKNRPGEQSFPILARKTIAEKSQNLFPKTDYSLPNYSAYLDLEMSGKEMTEKSLIAEQSAGKRRDVFSK